MPVTEEDIDAVNELKEVLEDAGVEVREVSRIYGYEETEINEEDEEVKDLGRVTNVDLSLRLEHFER